MLELLREENALLKSHISEKEAVINKKDELINQKEEVIIILEDHLAKLRHLIHGAKSEKQREIEKSVSQLELLFNEVEALSEEKLTTPTEEEEELYISPARRNRDRKIMALPDNISTEEILLDIAHEKKRCSCGCDMTRIGEESSEKLEYIPAKVKKIKLIRAKYVCKVRQEAELRSCFP